MSSNIWCFKYVKSPVSFFTKSSSSSEKTTCTTTTSIEAGQSSLSLDASSSDIHPEKQCTMPSLVLNSNVTDSGTSKLFTKMFNDSIIAKSFSLGRRKCGYFINFGTLFERFSTRQSEILWNFVQTFMKTFAKWNHFIWSQVIIHTDYFQITGTFCKWNQFNSSSCFFALVLSEFHLPMESILQINWKLCVCVWGLVCVYLLFEPGAHEVFYHSQMSWNFCVLSWKSPGNVLGFFFKICVDTLWYIFEQTMLKYISVTVIFLCYFEL